MDVMTMPPSISFSNFMSHPIPSPAVGVGAEAVTAMQVEVKDVSGKLPVECLFHHAFSDVSAVRGGDDAAGIDSSTYTSVASASSSGPDFSLFVIGLCHFGPPVSLLI